MLADPRALRSSPTSPVSGCTFVTCAARLRTRTVSGLRRQPSAGVPARDRAVLRQHHSRRSQRPRLADGGLQLPQRAARDTTGFRPSKAATSAAWGSRSRDPPGPAWPGEHAAAHVTCRSHGTGRARQMGARESARCAAAATGRQLPPLDEQDAGLSLRARMESHRRSPSCAACHRIMDPIGLALENFDAVGAWRTVTAARRSTHPVSSRTALA